MKKVLLGTTVLASAAVLAISAGAAKAAPIKAEVRGYHYEYFAGSFQDVDETAAGDDRDPAYFDHHFDNEIHFKGMTTLDNGLNFGFEVQLEGRTDDDQIDEAFIFISGDDFGRFLIGDENGAAYLMTYQAPVPTTIDVNETEIGFVNGLLPDSFDLSDTAIDAVNLRANDNDSGKIMYFTPRIAGIQLGASYAAIAEGGGDDNSSDRTGDQWNNASLGLNYLEDFNGIGLALSGGFVYADTSQSGPNDGADDLYGVNTGFNVSFSGFTVGAGFAYQEGSEGTAAGGTRELLFDSYGYNVGLTYETGAYTFGAAYQRGKSSGLAGDGERNTLDQIVVGFNYVLGPGIAWELTGMWWDADGESRSEADIVAAG
jgi:hypothetical protein